MRTALTFLGLTAFASLSAAHAAHITVTAMGDTYDLECSEILVDGEEINWAECGILCNQINNVEGWDCSFSPFGAYIIIDGPPDSDLNALFKSDVIDWDAKPTPTRSSTTSRR